MTEKQSRRGRPKGSGIDDTVALTKIARAMSADASLNATTAIRQIGVSDPSSIRRLRDKLKAAPAIKMVASASRSVAGKKSIAPLAKFSPDAPEAQVGQAPPPPPGETAAAADAPAGVAPGSLDPNFASKFALGTPLTAQAEAMRLAADAASAIMRLYIHCMGNAMRMNPMLLALQGQTFMNQMLAGAFPRPDKPAEPT